MNYIELINQFWSTRRRVRLTSAEADLYFCLLQECNLRDWTNPFECPNGLICALINVNEKTLLRARNGLQQKGYIEFEKGQRKAKSPVYRICLYTQNSCLTAGISGGKKGGFNIKQNKTVSKPPIRPPAGDAELPLVVDQSDFADEVKVFYNDRCKSLRPISAMTDKRKQAVNARMREHGREAVFAMITKAGQSRFLSGQNGRGWSADFDWIFKPTNFVKVLEGKYDTEQTPNGCSRSFGGNPDKEQRDRSFAAHIAEKVRGAGQEVADRERPAPGF